MDKAHAGEDLVLLHGEKEDIRQEAIAVAGEDWLYSPNAYGRAINDSIEAPHRPLGS